MKNKRNIYCDYQFWEDFFDMEDRLYSAREKTKLQIWFAFEDFLSNNNLFFNVLNQGVSDETNGGRKLNEIMHKKGGAGIKFIPKKFPRIELLSDDDDDRLNSVFLTTLNTPECEHLSKSFGVIVYNLDMIFSGEHVFKEQEFPFDKENGLNWNYLQRWSNSCPSISYCNSLVIADRYLLYDSKYHNVFENNVKPIFNAFLPQSLGNDIVFTICIVAEKKCASIDDKLAELESIVKELRPDLRFKLNIFDSNKIHDRSIITNNVILICGPGFDVIGENNKPLKSTVPYFCFPFLQSSRDKTYLAWINDVLKEERKCRSFQENYWGAEETRHHLLDYYYEEPPRLRATYMKGNPNRDVLLRATRL